MLVNIVLILPNEGGKLWEVFERIISVAESPAVCATLCHYNRKLTERKAMDIMGTHPRSNTNA